MRNRATPHFCQYLIQLQLLRFTGMVESNKDTCKILKATSETVFLHRLVGDVLQRIVYIKLMNYIRDWCEQSYLVSSLTASGLMWAELPSFFINGFGAWARPLMRFFGAPGSFISDFQGSSLNSLMIRNKMRTRRGRKKEVQEKYQLITSKR